MKENVSIIHYLDDRAHNRNPKRRRLYSAIKPTYSISNITLPLNLLLYKFTHDGKILVGFLHDSPGVIAYDYLGVEHLADTLTAAIDPFHKLFKLRYAEELSTDPHQSVNGDILLFTEDNNHMIVLAEGPSTELPNIHDMYETNESEQLNRLLNDYLVICIKVDDGKVTDSFKLVSDNLGDLFPTITLYGDTLALMSVRHQTIKIFRVHLNGRLEFKQNIGRFCYPDDLSLIGPLPPAHLDKHYPILKHRILVFLWRISGSNHYQKLWNYYRNFYSFHYLRMSALQFINKETFLIRYSNNAPDEALFVFYNYVTTEVEAIYDERDPSFQSLIRDNIHDFILPTLHSSQSRYFVIQDRENTLEQLKMHHHTLCQTDRPTYREESNAIVLPLVCQNVHVSPYLDAAIYRAPMDQIPLELGRMDCRYFGKHIRFLKTAISETASEQFGFDLSLTDSLLSRCLSYLFHPTEPLIVTNEITHNDDIMVNLHFKAGTSDNDPYYLGK